jgi:hypothetical protein
MGCADVHGAIASAIGGMTKIRRDVLVIRDEIDDWKESR